MGVNLTRKIIEAHLVEGRFKPGEEIALRMDHTLLQDATGTMAMLDSKRSVFVRFEFISPHSM